MQLVAERPPQQYDNAVFVKPGIQVWSTTTLATNNTEVITMELSNCMVNSVYKLPLIKIKCIKFNTFNKDNIHFLLETLIVTGTPGDILTTIEMGRVSYSGQI